MNPTRDVLTGVFLAVAGILALPLVPLIAAFRGRLVRATRIQVPNDWPLIVERYPLPRWLRWFDTPDEYLPGALYERRVIDSLQSYGTYLTTIKWLSANRMYGLAWAFGRPASGYLDLFEDGYVESGDLWRWRKAVGPLVFMAGWKVHRADYDATAAEGPFIAIPFVSVRAARNA
jgi:hypothetical protein